MSEANTQSPLVGVQQLIDQERFDEAESLTRSALARDPENPQANFLLASALARQGRVSEATPFMERASAAVPENPNILDALGQLYSGEQRYDDAAATFEKILSVVPEGPMVVQALLRRGGAFAKAKRFGDAAEDFKTVTMMAPDYSAGWHNLGNVLLHLKNSEHAVDAFRKAHALEPANPFILYALGRAFLWTGSYDESVDYLSQAVARAPAQLQMLSYKILALRHAGKREEADELEGINDMIIPVRPGPPEGFASIDEWNAALRDEIVNHPALTSEFKNRATRNGAKVDRMFAQNKTPLFEKFETQMRAGFADALAQMPRKKDHPLPLEMPGGYHADMWANVMYDGGHQVAHNHPKGWFSACYYCALPDRVSESGDAHEGWIEFGGTAYDYPEPEDAPKRQIQPEEGLLLVFPSYVFHRTVPFSSDQIRISCAFDAKPLI